MNKVYMNGRLVAETRAKVSVYDRGLLYGDGIFETIKADNGRLVFFGEHLKRLKDGARALGLPLTGIKGIEEGTIRLLKTNRLLGRMARVRVTVTRGEDTTGPSISSKRLTTKKATTAARPTIIITARAVSKAAIARLQHAGVKATLLPGAPPPPYGVKSLNYLGNVLGLKQAASCGAYEGIFVDEQGLVSEGTTTNVFIVKGGVLKTPPANPGGNLKAMLKTTVKFKPASGNGAKVLPGITRKAVIAAAKKEKVPLSETPISAKELEGSDEVFITNSIIEVVPITRIDGKRVGGDGLPGPLTRLLQASYRALAYGG